MTRCRSSRLARIVLTLTLGLAPSLTANQVVLPGSAQVSTTGRARDAMAAYNTVNRTWLVVWREDHPTIAGAGDILGRIVREDHTFATAPFVIGGGVQVVSPRAAHDPIRNEWLVVYGSGPLLDPGPMQLIARKVTSTGALVDVGGPLLSTGNVGEAFPDVAPAQSTFNIIGGTPQPAFLVVWQQNFGALPGIVAVRIFDSSTAFGRISVGPQFRVDTDASLPSGRRSTRPRITEFAPTTSGKSGGQININTTESFHRVVFEVESGGQKDVYLAALNLATVKTTVRLTQTAENESAPVVAYNPVSERTMVLFERPGSVLRGQILGEGAAAGLLNLAGGDFAVATGITPVVSVQGAADVFFASAENGGRLGLGCIAGQRVLGTPSSGTGTGSTQPFLSPSSGGGVCLTFLRTNADGTRVIRASIVDTLPAIPNNAPVARAGSDLEVAESALFTLDGSSSSDPDGDPLRHQWSRTGGGSPGDFFVSPAETSKARPQLEAPRLGTDLKPITLTYQLAVDDFRLDTPFTSTDTVAVRVVPGADINPPIARAGPNQTVNEDAAVVLDGSTSSDPDGDPLAFSWTLLSITPPAVSPASVALTGANTSRVSFTAPRFGRQGGIDLRFKLTASSPRGGQGEDEVVVHVRDSINDAPDANAGADLNVDEGTFRLDGSASKDPNGDPLTFRWEVVGQLGSLGSVEFSDPTSRATDVVARVFNDLQITIRLTVKDPAGAEDTDDLAVRIRALPMQVTSISPMKGSPGTRVTIQGSDLAAVDTKVFFNGSDLTHQGIIEKITDTEITVKVPAGGPTRFRVLEIKSKMRSMRAFDYLDVTTGPVTVKKGSEEFTSTDPFEISHLQITDAFLSQGMEFNPLVRKKDTLLQLRVNTAPVGPQLPLPGLSSASCAVLPSDGSPGFNVGNFTVPPRALAGTAQPARIGEAVNFFIEGSRLTAPAYKFSARLFNNGVEVAAFDTTDNSGTFTPTRSMRILGVKIVPFEDGSVSPAFDAERPQMQANIDAGVKAFRRIYPVPDAEFVFWPDEVELPLIVQDDGKVHIEAIALSKNFLINQVGGFIQLVVMLEAWNLLHPDQEASVVVGFVAESLYAPSTSSGVAVPPSEMMSDIVKFVATKNLDGIGELLLSLSEVLEDALCFVSGGLFCKDPVDILLDFVLGVLANGPLDITGRVSLVVANSAAGSTLSQEVGHNLGFVNPFKPEHDEDNISHSRFDEDNDNVTMLSAPHVAPPIFNPVFGEQALFHSTNRPKSVMSYAPADTNANTFFEPDEYLALFNAFRTDVGGGSAPGASGGALAAGGGAGGPALKLSGHFSLGGGALVLGEARPALPSEPLSIVSEKSVLTLAFLDGAGRTQAENGMPFNVALPIHGHGEDGTDDLHGDIIAFFSVVQEIPAGTARVELRHQGRVIWTRSALGVAPAVEISSPRGGETVAPGAELLVRWIGFDADDDELTYSLFSSLDGGATFEPIAVALRATEHRWSTEASRGSDRAVLKVVATDGFHSSESISGEFRLGGGSPLAAILLPAAGAKLVASQPIALNGSARAAGGAEVLNDAAYRWSLVGPNPAVVLGVGRTLLAAPLPAGPQRIRLEVDVDGRKISVEVAVELLPDADGDGVDDASELAAGLDSGDPEDLFLDRDGDGVSDGAEVLSVGSNPELADTDGDELPDGRELEGLTSPTAADTDADGARDNRDNCPLMPNADQADADQDGLGDACEDEAPIGKPLLRRGDSNLDGTVDISDPSYTLSFLFIGGQAVRCEDAADANDDGVVDISDALTTLAALFLGGTAIPPPGTTACGVDPSADEIGCADVGPCR